MSNTTSFSNYKDMSPSDFEEIDIQPGPDELSDDKWFEVEDREWTDEQLMDDARRSRRKAYNKRNRDTAIECAIRETERECVEREEAERQKLEQLDDTKGAKGTKNYDGDRRLDDGKGHTNGADNRVSG